MLPKTEESLDGLLESLEVSNTPSLPEPEAVEKMRDEKDLKLDRFLAKFKDRVDKWKDTHPEQVPPPVFYDSDYKDWVWMSREQRRQK